MHLGIDFGAILMDFGGQVWAKLEASWPQKSMEDRSKKALAFPERSGDAPRSPRARNNEFSMVLGGLGGGESTDARGRAMAARFGPDP